MFLLDYEPHFTLLFTFAAINYLPSLIIDLSYLALFIYLILLFILPLSIYYLFMQCGTADEWGT